MQTVVNVARGKRLLFVATQFKMPTGKLIFPANLTVGSKEIDESQLGGNKLG